MCDSRPDLAAATDADVVEAIGSWAQAEAAACARRLAAIAELFSRRSGLDAAQDRASWWLDYWDAVTAEVAAAQGISHGMAASQLHYGLALRDRLPQVAALFAAGRLSYRLVTVIVSRTDLIRDGAALERVDCAVAEEATRWGSMSVKKTQDAVDYWVDRHDPGALRRTQLTARGREVVLGGSDDHDGTTGLYGRLFTTDAALLDRRLDQFARGVCDNDPRTKAQRRADALGALAARLDRLECRCGRADCPAGQGDAGRRSADVVIHVVAEAEALAATPAEGMSGDVPCGPRAVFREVPPLSDVRELLEGTAPDETQSGSAPPGVVLGGGVVPAPLLVDLASRAQVRPVVHPGAAPPEPRYRPSAALEAFVRCRDMTCRFPGCDHPADCCDLDHTVPFGPGATHASKPTCLCCRASPDRHAGEHVERGEQGGGGVPGYHHLSGPSRRHFCRSASAARTAASWTR